MTIDPIAPRQSSSTDFQLGTDRLRLDVSITDDFSDLYIANEINGDANVTVGIIDFALTALSTAAIDNSFMDSGVHASLIGLTVKKVVAMPGENRGL